jgi:hypothetical protein
MLTCNITKKYIIILLFCTNEVTRILDNNFAPCFVKKNINIINCKKHLNMFKY